ncbi:hypothetical protein GCM10009525_40830 [Streptosporangium amethystogenes subsp. fukuiense]
MPGIDQVPVGNGEPGPDVALPGFEADLLEGLRAQLDQGVIPAGQHSGMPQLVDVRASSDILGDQVAKRLIAQTQKPFGLGGGAFVTGDATQATQLAEYRIGLLGMGVPEPPQRGVPHPAVHRPVHRCGHDELCLSATLADPGQPPVRTQGVGVLDTQSDHLAPPRKLVVALLDGEDLLPHRPRAGGRQPPGDAGGNPVEDRLRDGQQTEDVVVLAIAGGQLLGGDPRIECRGIDQPHYVVHASLAEVGHHLASCHSDTGRRRSVSIWYNRPAA